MKPNIRLKASKPMENIASTFAGQFAAMMEHSTHNYEIAVNKLLEDVSEYRKHEVISDSEYNIIIGTAMDVMDFFNLDLHSLEASDAWYRASVIHQMGQGMLQTIRTMREDLTLDSAYHDALLGLDIGQRAATHLHGENAAPSPVTCHKWTKDRTQARQHVDSLTRYAATKRMTIGF